MKKILLFILPYFFIISCTNEKNPEKDPFLITANSIGQVSDTTMIKDLVEIFKNDSIRDEISGDSFTGKADEITIFDKSGNELLEITPKEDLEPTSKIVEIRIIDPKYKTSKGINSGSTFKEVKDNYKISSIRNSLRNLIVTINSANLYFTIDKNELPSELRYDHNLKIDEAQIPENAKINNLYLEWRD